MYRTVNKYCYIPGACVRSFCENKRETYYDVIISGAGMVGAAMACSLGMSPRMAGKKILLLEGGKLKQPTLQLPETYNNRVSSISPSSKKMLTNLGAWDYIASKRFQRVKRMQVWEGRSDAMITLNFDNLTTDVSYIIENDIILESLLQQIQKCKDIVEVHDGARVDSYELPTRFAENLVKVKMKNGDIYQTSFLIGADGCKSLVREAMNINTISWSYDQMGIVATLHLSEPTENVVAWQRYLPNSTIALLPLTDRLSSLVWSTSVADAKGLLQMNNSDFINAVNSAFWDDKYHDPAVISLERSISNFFQNIFPGAGSVRQLPPSIVGMDDGSKAGFRLSLVHASYYVNPRVALIGDAAHRIHPHLGLGVNLGFGDVECLSRQLNNCVYDGTEIGSFYYLKEYEQKRQKEVIAVMAVCEALHRLYQVDVAPVILGRSLGVRFINSYYPAKEYLMKQF